mgnify:CR=1 FL=1
MEGTLLKWTNYYNGKSNNCFSFRKSKSLFIIRIAGWQPRYFVLSETGVLSYYKSKELIHEGCKGSCLILACEVKGKNQTTIAMNFMY